MSRHISPSLLAADFLHLGEEVEKINNSRASWIHCDVMDGVFVPNISFGTPIVEAVSKIARKPLDVHLMIKDPLAYTDRFCYPGVDILTIHREVCSDLTQFTRPIRKKGVKAGISLSPDTPLSTLSGLLNEIDLVLIMSVHPGFGGQRFIEDTYDKVTLLKEMIAREHSETLVQVDGGITPANARRLFDCGVDILVTGTTVFRSADPAAMINRLLAG